MLEVGVLGPVRVLCEGTPVPVRGRRRVSLLATLVTSPGLEASRDRLIDAVWCEQLPKEPVHALESLVSQLRGDLSAAAGGSPVIGATPVGYRLDADVIATDVDRFRALVHAGRQTVDGDPAAAVAALSAALELWRGRLFDGVELGVDLHPLVSELTDLRRAAVDERIRARLDLGDHELVIGELEALTVEDPLRERPWAMLMLALYRCGRQTDALRAFLQARAHLVDVGAEPGPALSELEQQILRHDPSLRPPARRPAESTVSEPDVGATAHGRPVVLPRRSNLPEPVSSFVGRVHQLDELDDLVGDARLVTLTGIGGTGKTRLGQQIARRVADRFADGVWLVELAGVSDPGHVLGQIADVWRLRAGEGSLEEVLAGHLSDKQLLVLLDNCEHVLDGAVHATRHILESAAGVSVLATSRESLGIPGEVVFTVPPLELPAGSDADRLGQIESVALFLDRARSACRELAVDDDALATISAVCARVDGIPLAIELAAARLRSMTPAELLDRLTDSFHLLSGKSATPRQRTIDATIAWSDDLLKPETAVLFRRLSVFAGGFDIDAAEAIGAGGDLEDWEIVERIDDLVDKSLVVAEMQADVVTRFRMLEPVRQYAAHRLAESSEVGDIRRAHADHFAALCATAMPHLHGSRQVEWMYRIADDYDNIRAALATLLTTADLDTYLDVCWNLHRYWFHDGLHLEGTELLLAGLESDLAADALARIKGWIQASELACDITLPISFDYAERAVALAEELGNPHALGRARMALGIATANGLGRYADGAPLTVEGDALVAQHPDPTWFPDPVWDQAALDLYCGWYFAADHPDKARRYKAGMDGFRQTGDPAMIERSLCTAVALGGLEDDDWIFEQLTRSVESARPIGSRTIHPHALMFRAGMAVRRNMAEEAVADADEAARLMADIGDIFCQIQSTSVAAFARVVLGRLDEAEPVLHLAARIAVSHRDDRLALLMVAVAADLAAAQGDHERAATLLGRADTHEYPPHWAARLEERRATLAAALGGDRLQELLEAGAMLSDAEILDGLAAMSV